MKRHFWADVLEDGCKMAWHLFTQTIANLWRKRAKIKSVEDSDSLSKETLHASQSNNPGPS